MVGLVDANLVSQSIGRTGRLGDHIRWLSRGCFGGAYRFVDSGLDGGLLGVLCRVVVDWSRGTTLRFSSDDIGVWFDDRAGTFPTFDCVDGVFEESLFVEDVGDVFLLSDAVNEADADAEPCVPPTPSDPAAPYETPLPKDT